MLACLYAAPDREAFKRKTTFPMRIEPKEYRTAIATLKLVGPQLIEIHYDEGCMFRADAVAEVQAKRRELMGNRPYATLTIIPEDVDYNLDTMGRDQGQTDRTESQVIASAVVVKASMIEMLTRLYFSYFPQLQRTFVTHDEPAARAWIKEQLEQDAANAGYPPAVAPLYARFLLAQQFIQRHLGGHQHLAGL